MSGWWINGSKQKSERICACGCGLLVGGAGNSVDSKFRRGHSVQRWRKKYRRKHCRRRKKRS